MSENDKKAPNVDYLEDKDLERFKQEVEFEKIFYSSIAGTEEFEIIPIPCMDGSYLSIEEKQSIAAYAKANNKKLLFRISLGRTAVTFGEDGIVTGISPEFNAHGFPC